MSEDRCDPRRTASDDRSIGEIVVALRRIAPASTVVGARRIDVGDITRLHVDEAESIANAVLKRQREFATGRRLLRELIGTDLAILPGPTRAPCLPAGVCGTLAHDDVVAVAAISRHPSIVALGIDVEPATSLAPEVAALILRPEEAMLDPHLAFTLKEAAYKAWSGIGGRILDHQDVSLQVDGARFRAVVVPDEVVFDGSLAHASGRWLAIVAVHAR
jgi:4'-phosphopantetheinyl transferase EntD